MADKSPPSHPGYNGKPGRTPRGRFAAGNKIGRGNPLHRKAHALRASLFATVTRQDLVAVTRKLIAKARAGDLAAIRELLDRVLGKPTASVELTVEEGRERIEDMSDDDLLSLAREGGGGA